MRLPSSSCCSSTQHPKTEATRRSSHIVALGSGSRTPRPMRSAALPALPGGQLHPSIEGAGPSTRGWEDFKTEGCRLTGWRNTVSWKSGYLPMKLRFSKFLEVGLAASWRTTYSYSWHLQVSHLHLRIRFQTVKPQLLEA